MSFSSEPNLSKEYKQGNALKMSPKHGGSTPAPLPIQKIWHRLTFRFASCLMFDK
ncbi:hypothetical protein EV13_1948 [Prochlorococcus sp. MIT 0702]|nr:hypothetical protein EV13_1948 [Prochlorococcus sp. MIT 0702]KGG28109.1 hypothetical protein EV12_0857 [Prochlorococcus sp. MIT 0701]KGG32812.1 hypothetical protein EV14_1954 [Prochlorococcus sp. MIT 0703]